MLSPACSTKITGSGRDVEVPEHPHSLLQENGIFVSDRLLVSHDNEYRAPKEGDDTSVEDLAKTARGAAEP